jgi:predicted phosphodiesterase
VKVAILSDVHSNLHALQAVLADVDIRGLTEIQCPGDIVGYGAYPNETVGILRKRCRTAICGNHDQAVIRINTAGMNPMAAAAVLWTAKNISAEAVDYLRSLKAHEVAIVDGSKVAIYHGSPRYDDEYVYETDASSDLLEMSGANILIMGHTHVPYVKRLPKGLIANAGSVGQPRDNDPRASYLILDTSEPNATIVRVAYDVKAASQAIIDAGLPPFLGSRLLNGI